MTSESRLRQLIGLTHKHGVAIKAKIAELLRISRALERLNSQRRKELRDLEQHRSKFTMYDSIDLDTIPKDATAVAGYVGGKWPTYNEMVRRFPRAKHLSIAVFASQDAECLDIETGDAIPAQAPEWVKRQKHRGVKRPCLYANRSTMPLVRQHLTAAGIRRQDVRLWVADWTFAPHIPDGCDACQYSDRSQGRNLDVSLCLGNFL